LTLLSFLQTESQSQSESEEEDTFADDDARNKWLKSKGIKKTLRTQLGQLLPVDFNSESSLINITFEQLQLAGVSIGPSGISVANARKVVACLSGRPMCAHTIILLTWLKVSSRVCADFSHGLHDTSCSQS
jgi:hypothetical protein